MLSSDKLSNNKKETDPFKIERLRRKLADELNFLKLSHMYSRDYPEIKDRNTSRLWNLLNKDNLTLREEKNPMLKDRLRTVVKMVERDNLNILNVGFGSANLEKIFFSQKKTFNWHGIDISQFSVKNASKKYPRGNFKVGSVNSIKSKDNYFNYVIGLEVLEHIRPSLTFKALGEMYRVLKRGGKLIVSVPLNEGLEEMVLRNRNPNAHVREYSPSLVKAELKISGFKILREKQLFAFHNYYKIKTFIANYVLPWKFKPNNIIILAQKL